MGRDALDAKVQVCSEKEAKKEEITMEDIKDLTILKHLLDEPTEKRRAQWMDTAIQNQMCKGAACWSLVELKSDAASSSAPTNARVTNLLALAATADEADRSTKKANKSKVGKAKPTSITDMLLAD